MSTPDFLDPDFTWSSVIPGARTATPLRWVCWVCARRGVRRPTQLGGARGRACVDCLHLDVRVAALHGAVLLTPLDDQWCPPERTLHGSLVEEAWSDAPLLAFHLNRVRDMAHAVEQNLDARLLSRRPGWPATAGTYVRWEEWTMLYPASPDTSADAYREYVALHYPHLLDVEPRLADRDWLARMAT